MILIQESGAPASMGALPWDTATKITTPLMLLAFIAVLWLAWRLMLIRAETERLVHVPEVKRHELAERLAAKYGVPVADLSPEARVEIVRSELAARRQHDRRISIFAFTGFVLTAVLWYLSIAAGPARGNGGPVVREELALSRIDPAIPFPGTICLGNPALPPEPGCVALLGGPRTRQTLVLEVENSDARNAVGAQLKLHGLFDQTLTEKPSCIAADLGGITITDGFPLTLDQMSISDRLSDEPEISLVTIPLPSRARKALRGTGQHHVTIEIPAECDAPGLVAFRTASMEVQWQ